MTTKARTIHVAFSEDETAALEKRSRELEADGIRIPLSTIVRGIVARDLGVTRGPRAGVQRARPRGEGRR